MQFHWTHPGLFRSHRALRTAFAGTLALGLSFLAGCGFGSPAASMSFESGGSGGPVAGILHGGPSPIIGATVSLYTTSSSGYGAAATFVASTMSLGDGSFNLATAGTACPPAEFAYITAYGGVTNGKTNTTTLLMAPIGQCSSVFNYSTTAPYNTTTYKGPTIWINEVTTAISAYALGNFMTVTNGGVVNIGAPANNHSTASSSSTTPSAAGLSNAFATALAIVNNHTGQPNAYTNPGTSPGGVIPGAELLLLGNILQACVNSTGTTGTNSPTANDGSPCGRLYSMTTPPQTITPKPAMPVNTMQAMLDLARFPNPSVNMWDSACMTSGAGTTTATSCLFNLSPGLSSGYAGSLTSAPPDWALAITYDPGYGATASPGNLGLSAPFYVALDYLDNVYVLNYDDYNSSAPIGAKTWTNVLGFQNNGAPIFSSAKDTTDLFIRMIATDTVGHVFGAQNDASTGTKVYNATTGALVTTVAGGSLPQAILVDPFNNLWTSSSSTTGINLRRAVYTSPSTWTAATVTTTAPTQQILTMSFTSNLDIYELGYGGTTPNVYMLPNMGTVAAPSYATVPTLLTLPSGSATTNGFGIGATSTANAFVMDSNGLVPITKGTNSATTNGTTVTSTTSVTAGTPTVIPAVYNSTLYSHYLSIDGNNWMYSGDGANNSAVSGISVYDSADNLALGTYKGCAIPTGTTTCVGYVVDANNGVAIQDPRSTAIDSAGDIWVVSAGSSNWGSQNLTELVGAAAPTWPGLSMAKFGTPQ